MALFNRGSAKTDEAKADAGFRPNPEKALSFLRHARTAHDSTNYPYAMTLWLQGLKQDPTSRTGLEEFFKSEAGFLQANPKAKGPTKEQAKAVEGKDDLSRYLQALLAWGTRPEAWSSGQKAMEIAAKLELDEAAYWLGERVLARAMGDAKAKKDAFVTLMRQFESIGGYDKAVIAGERALALDPTDSKLDHEVRNMSAESTMSSGGYDQTGHAGGFRRNVRDQDKQVDLEASDKVVKSEGEQARLIQLAREDYESRPDDYQTAKKLGRLLRERGTGEDEKDAIKLFLHMHKRTGAYEFKKDAGDLQMRVGRRRFRALVERAKDAPDNAELAAKVESGRQQILDFEIEQFRERVAEYPTDLKLRYELGRRLLEMGQHDEAIEWLQQARGTAGVEAQTQRALGEAFAALGYTIESVNSFRDAIKAHPIDSDDLALELRYGLMRALRKLAEENDDLGAASEAFDLAASISSNRFGFRDIRDQRGQIQELVKRLKDDQA